MVAEKMKGKEYFCIIKINIMMFRISCKNDDVVVKFIGLKVGNKSRNACW